MTTLQSIGFTLAGGASVFFVSLGLFGLAVRQRSIFIAPRATARPPDVIYNRRRHQKITQSGSFLRYYRNHGNPWTGWIPWTLSLTYDTLLKGVPGTGTRENGKSGSLLRVNLDGIVLLRFHSVCLKVAAVAAVLFLAILLPSYLSAQCYTKADETLQGCSSNVYNLTNYERTTLANVPSVNEANPLLTVVDAHNGILWRLYAAVFCFWIVSAYLCHLLREEWVQILAMRRVYYLEYDIWGERREELKQTLLFEEIAQKKREQAALAKRNNNSNESNNNSNNNSHSSRSNNKRFTFENGKSTVPEQAAAYASEEPHLTNREPWIPHPENRDTIPNISLYSILVGGLPSLPEQAADSFDAAATIQFSRRESIDWQLSLTTTFFDHCVPNQPGFSSSVAAVTIIPSANDLSQAWRKWYAAASKLRRLRFIREQIKLRRHFDIESNDDDDSVGGEDEHRDTAAKYGYGDECDVDGGVDYGYGDNDEVFVHVNASEDEVSSYLADFPKAQPFKDAPNISEQTPRGIYDTPHKNKEYYKQVLGSALGPEHDTHIYDSLGFGPEQASIYAREFAQSAAPCCPNGCNEGRVRRAPIDELLAMEKIVAVEVHQANMELREARSRATRADTALQNLHDQQQNQAPKVAPPRPTSCLGGVSPHSCVGGGMPQPTLQPDEEVRHEVESPDDIVQRLHSKPMASRYERQSSQGEQKPELVDRQKSGTRIDMSKIDGLAKSSGELSLEATLYKRSTSEGTRSNLTPTSSSKSLATMKDRKESHPLTAAPSQAPDSESTKTKKKNASHRKTPSLDGLAIPSNLSMEAQLIADASSGSDGSNHRRPTNDKPGGGRKLSNISEGDISSKIVDPSDSTTQGAGRDDRISEVSTSQSQKPLQNDGGTSTHWSQVETYITEAHDNGSTPRPVPSGGWKVPSFRSFFHRTKHVKKWATQQSKEAVDKMARESTYAVVTFTSRQAAVAARSCLADGRGQGRWNTLKDLPIPPLADAAPGDLVTFRNCCRPVTLSISDQQKSCRNYLAIMLLAVIYIFYTIPLTMASQLVNPENLENLFPQTAAFADGTLEILSGFITALIWSAFFAICPFIFKSIANFGSKATSVANAEMKALQYFWWFMVCTAFSGQLLVGMGANGWNQGLAVGSQIQDILREIALTIPSGLSASWLNWIILRVGAILPLNYLLQVNTFLFYAFGMNCCSRMVRGGGPGGPVPYRLYIDSGVVLLCLLALAPASPLVAPACVLYYLFCQPLLRRNLIFMYRPKFDGGGFRWPFIFTMCISSLVFAEILLTVQMALKQAAGPAAFAAIATIPTLLFQKNMRKQYQRCFMDAALLQTSLLDGWDTAAEYSVEKREEFRQFLVDAHKAAYVPICLAGTDTDEFLTAEPAIVIQNEIEEVEDAGDLSAVSLNYSTASNGTNATSPSFLPYASKPKTQHGVTLRRAVNALAARRKRTSSTGSLVLDSLIKDDELSRVSHFDRSLSSRDIMGSSGNHHHHHSSIPKGNSFGGSERNLSDNVFSSSQASSSSYRYRAMMEGRSWSSQNSADKLMVHRGDGSSHTWKARGGDQGGGMFDLKEDAVAKSPSSSRKKD